MKETAVEWLMKELKKHGSGAVRTFPDLFEQAKEKELEIFKELYNENFKSEDWEFEVSSGYYGYRNKINGEWLYECDYKILKNKQEQ